MKRSLRLVATAILVALFAASCATVPVSQRDGRVEALLTELNTADVDRLMELSARPFLLDGEIIALEGDLRTLWTNLRGVGFAFDAATIVDLGPVSDTTYREFGDTMDVRVWFQRYTAEDAGTRPGPHDPRHLPDRHRRSRRPNPKNLRVHRTPGGLRWHTVFTQFEPDGFSCLPHYWSYWGAFPALAQDASVVLP
jgi:hypothetical protein